MVCPALNSRLRTWTSDEDPARAAAQTRLGATLERLSSVGIEARGDVGDVDPLVAVEDAVRTFRPNELVVSTHPEGRSNWLERGVVSALRERYDVPVTHVVVDLEHARDVTGASRLPPGCRRRRTRRRPRSAAASSESLNDGIAPWPFVTRSTTSAFAGFDSSRFGPTAPAVPASASV